MWNDYLGLAAVLAALPQGPAVTTSTTSTTTILTTTTSTTTSTTTTSTITTTTSTTATTITATTIATTTTITTTTTAAITEPASPPSEGPAAPAPAPAKSLCGFCKHNGEAKHVYSGHSLRDAGGRVQCPVLRNYVCPQCGATQDRAHTKRFCPLTRRGYTSVYSRSARNAAGRRAASGRAAPAERK